MATMATAATSAAILAAPTSRRTTSRGQSFAAHRSQVMGSSVRMTAAIRAAGPSGAPLRVSAAVTPSEREAELQQKLADLIKEAKDICESGSAGECAVMWDNIEEISAEAAHARVRAKDNSDPLEQFCADNPETDECRTYED